MLVKREHAGTWQWTRRLHSLENSSWSSRPFTFSWWAVKSQAVLRAVSREQPQPPTSSTVSPASPGCGPTPAGLDLFHRENNQLEGEGGPEKGEPTSRAPRGRERAPNTAFTSWGGGPGRGEWGAAGGRRAPCNSGGSMRGECTR